MRGLLPFIACLMLVLTGWGSMAHAAEMSGGSVAGIEFSVHAPGDGDEVPADGDSALPHHHGTCHGHDVGTPAAMNGEAAGFADMGVRPYLVTNVLAGVQGRVLPRPPRA
ncbi:hypothetical protein [Sphingomonas sp. GM_Shp_2]|uniref:hypothetical protein n=1 Tax=Sphingomonas sp. GM_Shp_2 TaxID=2937380 RepID=UPI002269A21E|nr:hypothetical protein [Sphingomonas sp. GM_Shp_2]